MLLGGLMIAEAWHQRGDCNRWSWRRCRSSSSDHGAFFVKVKEGRSDHGRAVQGRVVSAYWPPCVLSDHARN
jgi:hypothetical protein